MQCNPGCQIAQIERCLSFVQVWWHWVKMRTTAKHALYLRSVFLRNVVCNRPCPCLSRQFNRVLADRALCVATRCNSKGRLWFSLGNWWVWEDFRTPKGPSPCEQIGQRGRFCANSRSLLIDGMIPSTACSRYCVALFLFRFSRSSLPQWLCLEPRHRERRSISLRCRHDIFGNPQTYSVQHHCLGFTSQQTDCSKSKGFQLLHLPWTSWSQLRKNKNCWNWKFCWITLSQKFYSVSKSNITFDSEDFGRVIFSENIGFRIQ